jgi:hypothetical protein
MKITHHIPTEQFGFTEVEVEGTDKMTYEEAKLAYGLPIESGEGLDAKSFNDSLDEYLMTNSLTNGANLYQSMSKEQQMIFQTIKRSLKRIEVKQK